jgi:hypothetical protein
VSAAAEPAADLHWPSRIADHIKTERQATTVVVAIKSQHDAKTSPVRMALVARIPYRAITPTLAKEMENILSTQHGTDNNATVAWVMLGDYYLTHGLPRSAPMYSQAYLRAGIGSNCWDRLAERFSWFGFHALSIKCADQALQQSEVSAETQARLHLLKLRALTKLNKFTDAMSEFNKWQTIEEQNHEYSPGPALVSTLEALSNAPQNADASILRNALQQYIMKHQDQYEKEASTAVQFLRSIPPGWICSRTLSKPQKLLRFWYYRGGYVDIDVRANAEPPKPTSELARNFSRTVGGEKMVYGMDRLRFDGLIKKPQAKGYVSVRAVTAGKSERIEALYDLLNNIKSFRW